MVLFGKINKIIVIRHRNYLSNYSQQCTCSNTVSTLLDSVVLMCLLQWHVTVLLHVCRVL